jgi:hypothetical protein
MAVPPAHDTGLNDTGTVDGLPATARTSRRRTALAAALALVFVVCTALAGWMLVRDGDDAGLDRAESREQVMSLADQFLRRLGTYGPDMVGESGEMDAYRDQVREVITPKFAADFDKQVATVEQLVAQAGVERSTEVFATGVSSIDDDSARVLIAGAFSDSYTQGKGKKAETVAQEPFPFRLLVDLVKVKGTWLVDDFNPAGSDRDPAAPAPSTGGAQ